MKCAIVLVSLFCYAAAQQGQTIAGMLACKQGEQNTIAAAAQTCMQQNSGGQGQLAANYASQLVQCKQGAFGGHSGGMSAAFTSCLPQGTTTNSSCWKRQKGGNWQADGKGRGPRPGPFPSQSQQNLNGQVQTFLKAYRMCMGNAMKTTMQQAQCNAQCTGTAPAGFDACMQKAKQNAVSSASGFQVGFAQMQTCIQNVSNQVNAAAQG